MNKRIYLSSPTMHGEEQEFVKEAFDTNWIAPLGPHVDAFEKEICACTGAPYAAALSSGTAAIHLAMKLLGVSDGDVVCSQSLTFSASCNPAAYERAKLVFIDSEKDTWNMDPEALKLAFEKYPHPKALIYVHLYGTPAKTEEILKLCREHQVPVIEDAAESLGAWYHSAAQKDAVLPQQGLQDKQAQPQSSVSGKMTGTAGDFGIYSFNGNKIITTSGGGMLVSGDEEAIKKARFLATQARDPARHYQHSQIGYNYRMSNVLAAIGRGQLKHLEEHRLRKKAIYGQYKEAFRDIEEVKMNPYAPEDEPNFWLSCMTLEKTDPLRIMEALDGENIESRPIWKPMHLQPVYADADFFTALPGDRPSAIVPGRPWSRRTIHRVP